MHVFSTIKMKDMEIESPHGKMMASVVRSLIPYMRSERWSTFTHHAQMLDSFLTLLALGSSIRGDLTTVYTKNRLCVHAARHGMARELCTAQGSSDLKTFWLCSSPPPSSLSSSVSPKPLIKVALLFGAHFVNTPTNACLQHHKVDRSADRVSPWHNDGLCSPFRHSLHAPPPVVGDQSGCLIRAS